MSQDHLDLFYYRNSGNIPSTEETKNETNKAKLEPPVNLDEILEELNTKWNEICRKTSKVIDKTQVARGIWVPDQKMVQLTVNKHLKQYIPHKQGEHFWFNPFEALFSIENRTLFVSYRDVGLSLEDAYNLLLDSQEGFVFYQVFSVLSRCGYYVHLIENNTDASPGTEKEEVRNEEQLKRKFDENKEDYSDSKKVNIENHQYPVVTSVRPLKLNHLRNLTKIDYQLIDHSNCKKDESYLYTVRQSCQPVEVHKKLRSLYSGKDKPILPLGSIIAVDKLSELMKSVGPSQGNSSAGIAENSCKLLNLHFGVYKTIEQFKNSRNNPLYYVIIIRSSDSLPSNSQIDLLEKLNISPVVFALVSETLEFNFYSFKKLILADQIPNLWTRLFFDESKQGDTSKMQ